MLDSGQDRDLVVSYFPFHPTPLIGSIVQHLRSPIFGKQEKKTLTGYEGLLRIAF